MTHDTFIRQHKLNWFFAILFLLFSTLAIEHQMDLEPHHHEHHQCQLFYLIGTAVASYIVHAPIVLQGVICTLSLIIKHKLLDIITIQARAPPYVVA